MSHPKIRFRKRMRGLLRQPVFIFITLWGHAAILIGTVSYYFFEHGSNPHIRSHLDAFYWAVATVTTVGSEGYPTTQGGKIIGIVMMISGSLFLWSYTALFVGTLVTPEIEQVEKEMKSLEKEVEDWIKK